MSEEDERLIKRIRAILKRRKGYSEKKMFGGVCFMIGGNMCVGPKRTGQRRRDQGIDQGLFPQYDAAGRTADESFTADQDKVRTICDGLGRAGRADAIDSWRCNERASCQIDTEQMVSDCGR